MRTGKADRLRFIAPLALVAVLCAGCGTPMTREQALAFGSFEVVDATPAFAGIVFGAPHGTADCNTGIIVKNLSRELGIGGVIANGFTRRETGDRRVNVNRPTEGAGLTPSQEPHTPRAGHVWEEYRRLLLRAGGGKLVRYFELHCNDHPSTHGMVEVATVGVSYAQALKLKGLYDVARDKAVAGRVPRVAIRMEPVDPVYMGAGGAKTHGSLALAPVALHIELPVPVTPHASSTAQPYGKVLATFIRGAIEELR